MGRIYDALKRAESAPRPSDKSFNPTSNSGNGQYPGFTGNGQKHPWESSAFTGIPADFVSASTAHTAEAPGGPALPGGSVSRDVGATLGAVGSARAVSFSSREVLAARVEPHLVAVTSPRSPECEQFRALRTRLLQASEREHRRSFVITSAGMGEGKTLTALNLAWLLAQTDGATALLIDADLRQPCAADYFGIDAEFGLSEILTGQAELTKAIVKLEPAGLHLLPGGTAREDVTELLSGPRFGRLLEDAQKLFDYIIIDTPPLGIFSDASLVINRADGALLVVRASATRYTVVDRLLEQIPRARMLGVVLNRAETTPADAGYYYQPHRQQLAGEAVNNDFAAEDPEMIYIEEEGVS
jgi:capsular exopolysaccharide synthesis family protein